jgi:ribosomal protein S18 acetylase RimI-like enzyme
MTIDIHVLGPQDAAMLDGVDDDVFDHAVQPELLREFLANPSNVIVVARVEGDGQVIGMASGLTYVHPDKPLWLFINEVGVSSRFHGQGIGKRLMQRLLDWGRERGCAEAWVATEVGNTAARRLYESTGGVEDEERAVVYVYPLSPSAAPTD